MRMGKRGGNDKHNEEKRERKEGEKTHPHTPLHTKTVLRPTSN
jgi:hypothetical protein